MDGGRAAYRLSKTALNALTRTLGGRRGGASIARQLDLPGLGADRHGRGGARRSSVEEGADTAVWLATLPDDGPSGGFFRDREPIPW